MKTFKTLPSSSKMNITTANVADIIKEMNGLLTSRKPATSRAWRRFFGRLTSDTGKFTVTMGHGNPLTKTRYEQLVGLCTEQFKNAIQDLEFAGIAYTLPCGDKKASVVTFELTLPAPDGGLTQREAERVCHCIKSAFIELGFSATTDWDQRILAYADTQRKTRAYERAITGIYRA